MSTTPSTYLLRTRRRSPKRTQGPLRAVYKTLNKRVERQKKFRYHHYA